MMIRLLGLPMMLGVLVGMSGCGKEIKVWTETYDNGKTTEEYQYYNHPDNNKRVKDEWYNSYYWNGEYYEIGRYKEDVKDGEWVRYHFNGEIKDEDIYENGECVEMCEGDE